MKIFLLFSIVMIAIFLIGRNFFNSAKRNLLKDQAAWSGKDIKIIHSNTKENAESSTNSNFLKTIANESKIYLEDQYRREGE